MSTVKDIEAAVRKLSSQELSAFRAWFAEFDAEAWDRQFQKDAEAGHLDGLERLLAELPKARIASP